MRGFRARIERPRLVRVQGARDGARNCVICVLDGAIRLPTYVAEQFLGLWGRLFWFLFRSALLDFR